MKKILVIILSVFTVNTILAQQDTISAKKEESLIDKINIFKKEVDTNSVKQLKKELELQKSITENLKQEKAELQKQVDDCADLNKSNKNKIKELERKQRDKDEKIRFLEEIEIQLQDSIKKVYQTMDENYLVIVKNFLYLPYEEYSIEKLGKKSFNKIKSESLKKDNEAYCKLLENYGQYVKDVDEFDKQTKTVKKITAETKLEELKNMDFYKAFIAVPEHEDYYLWKTKIKQIEDNLNEIAK